MNENKNISGSNMSLDRRYLEILSKMFPTIGEASSEVINLQSILNLPKGTEHFVSDLHGEYDAFSHVLRNGSGAVRDKINDVFGHTLGIEEQLALANLIYYPNLRIEVEREVQQDMTNWYKVTLYRLIEVCRISSSKYTRSKLRKALPKDYEYVIEELITEKPEVQNKEAYYESIINTIVEIGIAEDFIIALSFLIQRLVVDHLHVIGDIYDRGPGSHFIMDTLCDYHSVDIQWGNHDVVWMGAFRGQLACIANVIRISIRYGNLDMLEDGYGINLVPLAAFAMEVYGQDPCDCFKIRQKSSRNDDEILLLMRMHKAITVMQLKLEGQLVRERPEFGMKERAILDQIDYENGTVFLEGKTYVLKDKNFPTIDPQDPFKLSDAENEVMLRLKTSFRHCEKLSRHMSLLLNKGSLYKIYNGNLLYHGCMPLDKDGNFKSVNIGGQEYSGKKLYDTLDAYVRQAFVALNHLDREFGRDILWYLWCGPDSPLYGRHKMATFERYFLDDDEIKEERKDRYYQFLGEPDVAEKILSEFGLDPRKGHIINGHVPVHQLEGENPVKAGGKLIVIDGGFAKAYRKETGIAGYTLIFNSHELVLTAHQPFVSPEEAVRRCIDMVSNSQIVEQFYSRKLVRDTDDGKSIKERIDELKELIKSYRHGILAEQNS